MPFLIRWPGKIPAGQVLNGIMSLEDIVPTIMAAAGVPDIKEQLLEGYQAGDKHFRVHLDGYNQLPYLTGEVDESPRHEFFYYGERDLYAIRYNNWKVHFQTKDDWFAGALVQPTVPQTGEPARRPLRAAHGRSGLPDLRRREAVDGACLPPRSSSSTSPPSTTSLPAKRHQASTRRPWSRRSYKPPLNVKATRSIRPTCRCPSGVPLSAVIPATVFGSQRTRRCDLHFSVIANAA